MNFFKKLKKNNDGSIFLNRVTCYFILIIVLMFGIDVTLLLTQTIVTSYQTAYYAEKLSVQGGLLGNDHILPGVINSQTPCKSCYTNSEISKTFGQTMNRFGLTSFDWNIAIKDEEGSTIWIHNNGGTVNASQRILLPYMSVNELYISSKFIPKVSSWLWSGATIKKDITFISEYIER